MKSERAVCPGSHVYADLELGSTSDDSVANKRLCEQLKKEVIKTKTNSSVVTSLIKRTLVPRRNCIMEGARPVEVFSEYPHLKKCCYVSTKYQYEK